MGGTGAPAGEDGAAGRRRALPGEAAHGFQGLYSLAEVPGTGVAQVRILLDGEAHLIDVPIEIDIEQASALRAAKTAKAARLRPLLRCPLCEGRLDDQADRARRATRVAPDVLVCARCGASYPASGDTFDFLPIELRDEHRVRSTTNISAWGYDARATELIDRFADGLVLDCGCGLRPTYLPNVVNFEIVDYPTTDVLGVGQSLPFQDDSFDAVFSFAVLEHVTDPFRCATELIRVLKPGGELFVVVPFLQPFHGYPDHYYNMTSSGLRNLFGDHVDIRESGVPQAGLPIFTLSWLLNWYARGLDAAAASRFRDLRVEDLIGDPWSYLDRDFVAGLSAAATEELASTTYVVATKRDPGVRPGDPCRRPG